MHDVYKHKPCSIPPWDFPDLNIDISLSRSGYKTEDAHHLVSLAYDKITQLSDHLHINTDGSKSGKRSSAAFYVKALHYYKSYRLHSCSIYKAELLAILESRTWLEKSGYEKCLIISDSLSSLISI